MNDERQEPFFAKPIKQLSTKQMTQFFKHTGNAIRIIEGNYPRSAEVAREIKIFWLHTKNFIEREEECCPSAESQPFH
jgi:hypothetical protein